MTHPAKVDKIFVFPTRGPVHEFICEDRQNQVDALNPRGQYRVETVKMVDGRTHSVLREIN
jgi:hypothetical protein